MKEKFKVGDLIEVTRYDGKKYRGIVAEDYECAFITNIVAKEKEIGTTLWERFGNEPLRFQPLGNCKDIKVLSESTCSKASSSLKLNESLTKDEITYYTTPLGDGTVSVLCMCEGYGGWSTYEEGTDPSTALKESYFDSKMSKVHS